MARLIFPLLFVLFFSSGFSFTEWKESFYDQIKVEAVKGLKDLFKKDISIGSVEGIIAGQIILKDVKIPDLGQAQKVAINFNPAKYLAKKDIIPAISKITVYDGHINIKRDQQDRWNFASLIAQDSSGSPPPPFSAKLALKNCQIDYLDQRGFRKSPQQFIARAKKVSGKVTIGADKTIFRLAGQLNKGKETTTLRLSGTVHPNSGKYSIKIKAGNVDLQQWGNYTVPIEGLGFTSGQVDLSLLLSPPQKKGWAVTLVGDFSFTKAAAKLDQYRFTVSSGKLLMRDDKLILVDFKSTLNDFPATIYGSFSSFTKHNLDFKVALEKIKLEKLATLFPNTKNLSLNGLASSLLTISGTIKQPQVSGTIKLAGASIYEQKFSGQTDILWQEGVLQINNIQATLYKGQLTGRAQLNLNNKTPKLSLKAALNKINLASLSQNAPGIIGQATGQLTLVGPINTLVGELSTNLSRAQLLGQPIDKLTSSFNINNGDVNIKNFSASSKTAKLVSSGTISRNLDFNFNTSAQGIKLAGRGVVGPMETIVTSFEGTIGFKLNDQFIKSPLKNLSASGEAVLTQGKIGQQVFDSARGGLQIGNGLISLNHVSITTNQSTIKGSGQTGLGVATSLEASGNNLNLADLKILNDLLPKEAHNPSGQANIKINITGFLSKETELTSFVPFLDLNASAQAELSKVNFAGIPINQGNLNIKWQDHQLVIPQSQLILPDSALNFDYSEKNGSQIKGTLNLDHLKKITAKYGNLSGRIGLSLNISGFPSKTNLATSFWAQNFSFNQISFDFVKGGLKYHQGRLVLIEPVTFTKGDSLYKLTGLADFPDLTQDINLDLKLDINKAKLSNFIVLAQKIQHEISRRTTPKTSSGKVVVNYNTLKLPDVNNFNKNNRVVFYKKNGQEKDFLTAWDKILLELKQVAASVPEQNLGGHLFGQLSLKGKTSNLTGAFAGEVKNGYYRKFYFDKLLAQASLKNNQVTIKQFALLKKRGKLTAQGNIDLKKSSLNLNINADRLPLESLKAFFDEDFYGNFSLDAKVSGSYQNPTIKSTGSAKRIYIGKVHFDQLNLSVDKIGDQIEINNFTVRENQQTSKISGSISLGNQPAASLEASLKDNALGLINLITKEIKWREGKAQANLAIAGPLNNLNINGSINIKDNIIYVKAINSDIKYITGNANIKNSLLTSPSLSGFWHGTTSKNYLNPIALAGTVNLRRALKQVELNLVFAPARFQIDLPNLYAGELEIKTARLYGPFAYDLSLAPTLKGSAEAKDAVVTLTQNKGEKKTTPLGLDLIVDLGTNVYASMGDISTLDLAQILMNLEISNSQLRISGTMVEPSLLGKIKLKRGNVSIFNRDFSLLSLEQQKNYFSYDPDQAQENLAIFSGESGPQGAAPNINITAIAEIKNIEKDASGEYVKKKVIILSRLNGLLGSKDKENGLNISFNSFAEDTTKSPPEMVPAAYSDESIKVMLLPDFIKGFAKTSEHQDGGVDTKAVLADYLSSRAQTIVFRRIERDIEQRLGLESLTLEYNFGKKLRQSMGVSEERTVDETDPDWRAGFAKGFFDKFYIDIKTQGFEEETGTVTTTWNYQLTYKLTPIWSIIYYREPTSLTELTTGYHKTTLKAGLSLW